jgi:hypothetical protein
VRKKSANQNPLKHKHAILSIFILVGLLIILPIAVYAITNQTSITSSAAAAKPIIQKKVLKTPSKTATPTSGRSCNGPGTRKFKHLDTWCADVICFLCYDGELMQAPDQKCNPRCIKKTCGKYTEGQYLCSQSDTCVMCHNGNLIKMDNKIPNCPAPCGIKTR